MPRRIIHTCGAPSSPRSRPLNPSTPSRRAWLIYFVGVFAYVVAVTQRTTIGVAGVAAAARFHADAATLSLLAVLQLVVYAGMQVPVGMLIDRLGPRRLIIAGTTLMLVGQVLVGTAATLDIAIAGRVLVGAGDATVFTSVVRLVAAWFSGRIVPQLFQWLGLLGQLGQVVSAVPFALLLNESGWTHAFLSAAASVLLALVAAILVIRDHPAHAPPLARPASLRDSLRLLRAAMAQPGTWLGFWTHYTAMASTTTFSLMWGYPFMVHALGYAPALAAQLLIVPAAAGALAGPLLGRASARHPRRRTRLVLGVVALICLAWALLLAWPGSPPFALLLATLVAIGIGGPAAVIGFDHANAFNARESLGSANGVVNVGGFLASFLMMYLIGWVLDLRSAGNAATLYSLAAFKLALLVQYPVLGIGVAGLVWTRRRTRALAATPGAA